MAKTIQFDVLAKDRASKVFDKVGSSAESTSSKIGRGFAKMGKAIGAAAIGATAAIAAVGAAGAVMGIKQAAANEQAQISFTTMLGSAKRARAFMADLQKFAAATPFDMPGLQTAASSLISVGIDAKKVIPIMTTLGNVTSGMGTGAEGIQRATVALQQMTAAQRISGEDLNQLRDAGIPVYDLLSKATGKSTAAVVKLAQAGKLGKKELDQMMRALESGKGMERFAGLMDKQSQSLSGLWATFKDTLGQGLAKALQPVIPMLKDGIGSGTTILGKGLEIVSKVLPKIMSAGSKAFDVIRSAVGKLRTAGGRLTGWWNSDLKPALITAARQLMPMVKSGLSTIMNAMKSLTGTVRNNSSSWQQVGKFITTWVIPVVTKLAQIYIPLAVTGITAMIRTIQGLWYAGKFMYTVLKGAFNGIWTVISTVLGKIINGAAKAFGWVPGLGPKLKSAAAKFNAFRDDVNRSLHGIKDKRINVSTPGASKAGRELANIRYQIDHIPRHVTVGVLNKLAGARASGGPVKAGNAYLVGEAGPEVVTMGRDGYVHPNRASVGGTTINLNVSVAPGGEVQAAKAIESMLLRLKQSNGRLAFA